MWSTAVSACNFISYLNVTMKSATMFMLLSTMPVLFNYKISNGMQKVKCYLVHQNCICFIFCTFEVVLSSASLLDLRWSPVHKG